MTSQQAMTRDRLDQATRDRNRFEQQNRQLRTQVRKRSRPAPSRSDDYADAFVDPELQWRFEVQLAWVRRVSPAEKRELPLPEFRVGPRFLASLDEVQGVSRAKVAEVVVDVLTRRAAGLAGRELHQLRTGPGGDDPPRTRDSDGAVAWRVAVQRNTPSARRLHYWQCPDGVVELSRLVLHDDVAP